MGIRNVEAEPKNGHVTARLNTKSKQQAMKIAQEEFLARHINSNGPQDKDPIDPLDFETLPVEVLNKYKKRYKMDLPDAMTDYGTMLGSSMGKKTYSERNQYRITKQQLAENVRGHFLSQNVKESDAIANFIYAVNNEGKFNERVSISNY